MKRSMQVIAMVAFLGCFAILVIAAGSKKAGAQKGCGEEWNKTEAPSHYQADEKNTDQPIKEVAVCWPDHTDELFFPAQFLHRVT